VQRATSQIPIVFAFADYIDEAIATLSAEIERVMAPFAERCGTAGRRKAWWQSRTPCCAWSTTSWPREPSIGKPAPTTTGTGVSASRGAPSWRLNVKATV
jgi:hypothetical protein